MATKKEQSQIQPTGLEKSKDISHKKSGIEIEM